MEKVEAILPGAKKKNVPYLDAIRGVAVIFVFIRHAWGLSSSPAFHVGSFDLSPFIVMMSSGVDLFFVLSGFLLAGAFTRANYGGRPSPSISSYMAARIMRIGPPYWTVLVIVVIIYTPTLIPYERVFSELGLWTFLAHASFMQTTFAFSFGAYKVETPFWTLTIEMIFYLLLPLVVPLFYKRRWIASTIASILVAGCWLYYVRYGAHGLVGFIQHHSHGLLFPEAGIRFYLSHQIIAYLPHFAIGISIANIASSKSSSRFAGEKAGIAYFVTGIVLLVLFLYVHGALSIQHNFSDVIQYINSESKSARFYYFLEGFPFAIAYGLIILGATLGPEKLRQAISLRLLCAAGLFGYSIYLVHMPLLWTFTQYGWIGGETDPYVHFAKMMLFSVPVVGLASIGLFFAIERPSMAWSEHAKLVDYRKLVARPIRKLLWPNNDRG